MGDMGLIFSEMNEAKKKKHQEWRKKNREILRQGKIPFIDRGETILFREHGMPKVDFYPSTGRWKVVGKGAGRVMRGGAKCFLGWYGRQEPYQVVEPM